MKNTKTSSCGLLLLTCIVSIGITWTPSASLAGEDGKAQVKEAAEAAPETPAEQVKLGERYRDGKDGVEKDYAKALQCFEKAAAQGDSEGIYQLGRCHWYGWGVKKDLGKANELFLKAAEQGYAKAQCVVGKGYYYGQDVKKDYSKAFQWFEKAAAQEDQDAQFYLGLCYRNGNGVATDGKKAFLLFSKGAEQGRANSIRNLADCYMTGCDGIEKDMGKGLKLFESAADKGDEFSQMTLAMGFLTGLMIYSEKGGAASITPLPRNPDKTIKYAKMRLECAKGLEEGVYSLLLVSANLMKGDFKETRKIMGGGMAKHPALKWLAAGFILAAMLWLALIVWLFRKFKPASGAWSLCDIFTLILILPPLIIISQAALLLPVHLLVSTMLGTCAAGYACILIFAFIVKWRGSSFKTAFALENVPFKTFAIWLPACLAGNFLFSTGYEWICGLMGVHIDAQLIASLLSSKTLSYGALAFCLATAAFIQPILEELLFRGIIYQSLRTKMRPWIAIGISAALFSVCHFEVRWFIPIFAMGILLAYLRERTGSLYVPIALHCANNSIMVALVVIGWV